MLREIKNMSSRAISPDQGENPIMADTEVKKIICSSCGAEFEDTLPKCPYCGSLNYKGAEAEYLGKLESMRQDMQQLEQVPEKELKKKLKKKQKFVIKLLIILAALAAILAVIVFRAQYIGTQGCQSGLSVGKRKLPGSGPVIPGAGLRRTDRIL